MVEWSYSKIEHGVLVTRYKGDAQHPVVPDTLDRLPVIGVGEKAFYDKRDMKAVSLPDTIEAFGDFAFSGCQMLKTVRIGPMVKRVGKHAFVNCKDLADIEVDAQNESFHSSNGVLYTKSPAGVVCRLQYATRDEVVLPTDVVSVAQEAFLYNVELKRILLNDKLEDIGESAFSMCPSLEAITLPASVKKLGSSAFYACTNLKSVRIQSEITSVGSNAFRECRRLRTVVLSQTLQSVENGAFFGCTALRNISLHEGISSIGDNAFGQCQSIEELTLPTTLTHIGKEAFAGCRAVKTLHLKSAIPTVGEGAFRLDHQYVRSFCELKLDDRAGNSRLIWVPNVESHDLRRLYLDSIVPIACARNFEEYDKLFRHISNNQLEEKDTTAFMRLTYREGLHEEYERDYLSHFVGRPDKFVELAAQADDDSVVEYATQAGILDRRSFEVLIRLAAGAGNTQYVVRLIECLNRFFFGGDRNYDF